MQDNLSIYRNSVLILYREKKYLIRINSTKAALEQIGTA